MYTVNKKGQTTEYPYHYKDRALSNNQHLQPKAWRSRFQVPASTTVNRLSRAKLFLVHIKICTIKKCSTGLCVIEMMCVFQVPRFMQPKALSTMTRSSRARACAQRRAAPKSNLKGTWLTPLHKIEVRRQPVGSQASCQANYEMSSRSYCCHNCIDQTVKMRSEAGLDVSGASLRTMAAPSSNTVRLGGIGTRLIGTILGICLSPSQINRN